jgi:stage III sporulation protein AG
MAVNMMVKKLILVVDDDKAILRTFSRILKNCGYEIETAESGSEAIPAYSQNNSNKITEENDSNGGKRITNENTNSNTIVTTNEGGINKPFIVKEVKPKISGVIVISEGASNPDVKYKLYEAVKTVFNLQQYKINIYPRQKK